MREKVYGCERKSVFESENVYVVGGGGVCVHVSGVQYRAKVLGRFKLL